MMGMGPNRHCMTQPETPMKKVNHGVVYSICGLDSLT